VSALGRPTAGPADQRSAKLRVIDPKNWQT
jgi:hypothetical protein